MNELSLELVDGNTSFLPSARVAGFVSWRMDEPPRRIRVELLWATRGKGTVDEDTVDRMEVASPAASGRAGFRLRLPDQPLSFSGRLLSVVWAVRAVSEPDGTRTEVNIVVSPTGREIDLTAPR